MTPTRDDTKVDWTYGIPAVEWEDIVFEHAYGDQVREQTRRERAAQGLPERVTVQL